MREPMDGCSVAGMPIAVVATKMDKLKQTERSRNLATLERSYDTLILPTSALEHAGIDEVWKVIREWTRAQSPEPKAR